MIGSVGSKYMVGKGGARIGVIKGRNKVGGGELTEGHKRGTIRENYVDG